ncbi:MAG: hypothetical protein LIP12_00680 [Clostridiales bacterium]|nr:hypothetical protein [Clostridiales bacterium]
MEMDRQQEKLNEQIRKAKEQLKKLEEKDANLKKRIKEKREKELAAWTAKFDKTMQPLIERMFGADYFENIQPEEAVKHFSFLSEFYDASLPEGDRETSESLKRMTELPGDNSVMLDRMAEQADNDREQGAVGIILADASEMDYGTPGVFLEQEMEHNIPDDTIEQGMGSDFSDIESGQETVCGVLEEYEEV